MMEDPMERLERECKRRNWDLDLFLGIARGLPGVIFRKSMNSKVPPSPTQRKKTRSKTREELNRKAKELVRQYKEKHCAVIDKEGDAARDAKRFCKTVVELLLKKYNGNTDAAAKAVGVYPTTIVRMQDSVPRFDCLLKITKHLGLSIIIQKETEK